MGKLFLLIVAGAIVLTVWNIVGLVSGDEDIEVSKDLPGEVPASIQPSEEIVPEREVPGAKLSPVLFVTAMCSDWLHVKDWGFCQQGDQLPCGRVLKTWSNRLAVVIDGSREIVLRFARVHEFPEWIAMASMSVAPVDLAQSNDPSVKPGKTFPSFFGGSDDE